ncbi:SDR family NAD(P)-dependent oxidoreductase [Magnetospirillum sp. 64-120]|uniref:SDR family NAD(P)-dependent oxidoreductase n=1 Tax=Magnetospirillum sp. 64-120 TaxID=1895778 RepID=UPI00092C6747|nr:SDR family NAD(P)-dependent oxidoreductase [Magnetospirillum sp. 64-120]OJX71797.1 MAG: hypothetical protein BGO92_04180 [Magnetospirillum sp. 64-120]
MQLDGAQALVTGAGSGIGRALSMELARRGTRLILLGRNGAALEDTRQRLPDPTAAHVLSLDLGDSKARRGIADHVTALYGGLDLLVNNAGVVDAAPLADQDEDAWRRMLEINLLAPMAITRQLLPLLQASGQGRVVNVGSMFGDIAFPFFAAYSASKFGLRGWSEALRREAADLGVGVTYCAPRGTRTPAAEGFAGYAEAFRMRLDAPERVARRIVDGIVRDARDVYPRGPERLFLMIQRLFPAQVDKGVIRQMRSALADVRMTSASWSKLS